MVLFICFVSTSFYLPLCKTKCYIFVKRNVKHFTCHSRVVMVTAILLPNDGDQSLSHSGSHWSTFSSSFYIVLSVCHCRGVLETGQFFNWGCLNPTTASVWSLRLNFCEPGLTIKSIRSCTKCWPFSLVFPRNVYLHSIISPTADVNWVLDVSCASPCIIRQTFCGGSNTKLSSTLFYFSQAAIDVLYRLTLEDLQDLSPGLFCFYYPLCGEFLNVFLYLVHFCHKITLCIFKGQFLHAFSWSRFWFVSV
jgi:hypothetical protein